MGNIILEKLKELLNAYTLLYKQVAKEDMETRKLSQYCESLVGQDASPRDRAGDEVACAETVCEIIRHFIPDFPMILSTAELDRYLKKNYKQLHSPAPNLIIMSPTGQGLFKNGHTGIIGENNVIYSNNSNTGKLDKHWHVPTWAVYYGVRGKFPINYYDIFSPRV